MKKSCALLSLTVLAGLTLLCSGARAGGGRALAGVTAAPTGGQQAATPKPQWKSRAEYDDFQTMAGEKDPKKRIAVADGVLQKYPNSDFKEAAYVAQMGAYQQLGDSAKAIAAGQKAVESNPDNMDALYYLSFAFPFVFKVDDPEGTSKLSVAQTRAKHALEVLQKLSKPANASDEQFTAQVKSMRSVFNNTVGFVALQKKDYPAAITSFKAATEDNATDFYSFYREGLAYLFSTPRDYNNAVWYLARAVSLAQAAKDPNGEAFEKYLKKTYVDYHGNDQGLSDIVKQAAASPNPPDGFKVAAMETPKPTGNPNVDAFNTMTFPLKLGGEKAQKVWDQLKGQAIELGGSIDSVEKGADPGSYVAHIVVLDQSKAAGSYDIDLKDATQPNVMNLKKGDLVRFKGTADAYKGDPNLVLTLVGEIITDLPDKPPAKEKPKPVKKTAPAHRRSAAAKKTQG